MKQSFGVGWALLLLVAGCGVEVSDRVVAPEAPSLVQGGNGGRNGGDNLVADLVAGDFTGDDLVLSSCGGDSQSGYNVWFGDTDQGTNDGCLTVTTSGGTQLVDDIYFTVGVKTGASTQIGMWGRDAAGPTGIGYASDPMPVSPPAPVSAQGFTVHVHATDVVVWRLSGHNSQKKVARAGTVDIGDLVYRVP